MPTVTSGPDQPSVWLCHDVNNLIWAARLSSARPGRLLHGPCCTSERHTIASPALIPITTLCAGLDAVAFTLIIDDLVYPDGRTLMGMLGGGGMQIFPAWMSSHSRLRQSNPTQLAIAAFRQPVAQMAHCILKRQHCITRPSDIVGIPAVQQTADSGWAGSWCRVGLATCARGLAACCRRGHVWSLDDAEPRHAARLADM